MGSTDFKQAGHPEHTWEALATIHLSNSIPMPWRPPRTPLCFGSKFCKGKHHSHFLQEIYNSSRLIISLPSVRSWLHQQKSPRKDEESFYIRRTIMVSLYNMHGENGTVINLIERRLWGGEVFAWFNLNSTSQKEALAFLSLRECDWTLPPTLDFHWQTMINDRSLYPPATFTL